MGDDHDCDTQVRLRFGERQNRDTGRGGEGDRVDALPDLRRGVLRALERLAGRANRATDLRAFSTGNAVVPLVDGHEYFARLCTELEATAA